jgi:protocatechuate 3,4-dioxygenase alpha subunit
MAERGITPSQTVGPFFHFGLTPANYDFRGIVGDNLVTPSENTSALPAG